MSSNRDTHKIGRFKFGQFDNISGDVLSDVNKAVPRQCHPSKFQGFDFSLGKTKTNTATPKTEIQTRKEPPWDYLEASHIGFFENDFSFSEC